jgi:hypothetical protein
MSLNGIMSSMAYFHGIKMAPCRCTAIRQISILMDVEAVQAGSQILQNSLNHYLLTLSLSHLNQTGHATSIKAFQPASCIMHWFLILLPTTDADTTRCISA